MSEIQPNPAGGPRGAPDRFRPVRWLPGPHAQTVGAALLPAGPSAALACEIVELPDGDFVEAHWAAPRDPRRPVLVILPGLEGSSDSAYARRMIRAGRAAGWQAVVLHARGCGRLPNRLPRGYHAGETADLALFLDRLTRSRPPASVAAVGYSLGGNVLLKYLGERRGAAALGAAAAVSVPYDLADAAHAINQGFARVYRARLLRRMRYRLRQGIGSGRLSRRWRPALAANDFRSFDDLFTAPCHGFRDVDDYYARCSAGAFLAPIARPTLLIHAVDDPFMTPACLPDPRHLPVDVHLEALPAGGHVGFVSGGSPWRPATWLEPRILAFLARQTDGRQAVAPP